MSKDYRLWKGRKVEIWDALLRRSKPLGIGRYIRSDRIEDTNYWTPVFRMDRKIIKGYECWWLPLSVAEKIKSASLRK